MNNIEITNYNIKIPGAPNFTYNEFLKSDIAIRYNIKNIPNKDQLTNIEKLAVNVIQPVRNKFGRIRINSGFRCKELNTIVTGNKNSTSNHLRGEAADIEPIDENITLMDILKFIYNELPFRELIAEYFPNGWVHVAYRENQNSRILKLKDKNHNYSKVGLLYIQKLYPTI